MPMPDARSRFLSMVERPDAEIDLAVAALLIAKEEYPDLDVDGYRSRLDDLAAAALPRVKAASGNPFAAIDGLNSCLFGEHRFRGNTEAYFDPRNSFLNDVLDRGLGIPITLSIIYIEIAARVGLPIEGVGFPGHFLVRHADAGRRILIDPFHRGQILVADDCRRRLESAYGEGVRLEPRFFEAARRKEIIARILRNLKAIYLKSGDHERALGVLERLVVLEPGDAGLLRDRGLAHMGLGHHGRAAADLENYLRVWPGADDARGIRKQITAILRLAASLN